MLTIFNRKELITTMDMQRQSNIRSVLSANGIAYTVRTCLLYTSPSPRDS